MPDNFNTAPPPSLAQFEAVPDGTTNGAKLGTLPSGGVGARFYLPVGSSVTFTVAQGQPTSAPALTFTISEADTGPNWDEPVSAALMIYVTAKTGSPLFRWFLRYGTA